jgi:hypothetical protein
VVASLLVLARVSRRRAAVAPLAEPVLSQALPLRRPAIFVDRDLSPTPSTSPNRLVGVADRSVKVDGVADMVGYPLVAPSRRGVERAVGGEETVRSRRKIFKSTFGTVAWFHAAGLRSTSLE